MHDIVSAPLIGVLEEMVETWVYRLRDVVQYGPMPMRDVLDLAVGLRWAAEEAIRIEPGMARRLETTDVQRAAPDRDATSLVRQRTRSRGALGFGGALCCLRRECG